MQKQSKITEVSQAMALLNTYDQKLHALKTLLPIMERADKAEVLKELFNEFSFDEMSEISQKFTTGALLMLQAVRCDDEKKEDVLEVPFTKDIKAMFDTLANFNRLALMINELTQVPTNAPKPYNVEN